MGFYQQYLCRMSSISAMRNCDLLPYRKRLLAAAQGGVLEIGIGSGLNLSFYPAQVREIVGLEPAPRLIAMARRSAAGRSANPNDFIQGSAEAIPLDARSFDTVVNTGPCAASPMQLWHFGKCVACSNQTDSRARQIQCGCATGRSRCK